MGVDRTHIVVLNYNGASLLRECMPSLVEAAARSPFPCSLSVIDNQSTDESLQVLSEEWPEVRVFHEDNRGLASFNAVLPRLDEPVVLLLNNDVKLGPDAVGPMVRAVLDNHDALFAAPLCWDFDEAIYEGMRTRVRTRFGMVQGMCRVDGHEELLRRPDLTAAAGPVLAVHRERFLNLGGYDPLYFPGRVEDLDLGFRGWMAGFRGYYAPESLAYHRGFGSFGPAFGRDGCDRLAARNTLIFAWKNLSGARLLEHLAWLPPRVLRALLTGRVSFLSALWEAVAMRGEIARSRRGLAVGGRGWVERQEAFFQRFSW